MLPVASKELFDEYISYYRMYYGNDYHEDQGLNEITDTIAQYSKPGTWVDLGGGTSTFIWLPAFPQISKAYSVDKYSESFLVQNMVRKEEPSKCYEHILRRYNRSAKEMLEMPIDFIQCDLLGSFEADLRADNVSQFGLLGLCKSREHYYTQLDRLASFMNESAVFIGANWLLSDRYSQLRHLDNSYIKKGMIREWAASRGREVLTETLIKIKNDPNYTSVLIYAFL